MRIGQLRIWKINELNQVPFIIVDIESHVVRVQPQPAKYYEMGWYTFQEIVNGSRVYVDMQEQLEDL